MTVLRELRYPEASGVTVPGKIRYPQTPGLPALAPPLGGLTPLGTVVSPDRDTGKDNGPGLHDTDRTKAASCMSSSLTFCFEIWRGMSTLEAGKTGSIRNTSLDTNNPSEASH